MGDIAIRVESLSKLYRIGARQEQYYTLRDTLTEAVVRPFQKLASFFGPNGSSSPTSAASSIWALKDVSFEVKRGEVVGIIGRNGAGKSTLLKILSRITEPTEGRARIHGRVGSLLEVGTGFHNELTGRENIYLNGAILGMKKVEIDRKFDEIVAFAEVEQFIDTPVKHYSSGMYLRLAFAVAAHLEPEILIVDEVLAVGDMAFQKKCLGKMGEVAKEGRTVLFVSHNIAAVQHLCTRCLLLDRGTIVENGEPLFVTARYARLLVNECQSVQDLLNHPGRSPGSVPSMRTIDVRTDNDANPTLIRMQDNLEIKVTFVPPAPLRDVTFGLVVKNQFQVSLFGVNNLFLPSDNLKQAVERGSVTCRIEKIPLMPGIYYLDLYLGTHGTNFDIIFDATQFEVHPCDVFQSGKLPPVSAGSICWPATWRISSNEDGSWTSGC